MTKPMMIVLCLLMLGCTRPSQARPQRQAVSVCPPCPTPEARLLLLCLNGPKGSMRAKYLMYHEGAWRGYRPIAETPFCKAYDLDGDNDVDLADVSRWMAAR
jgi:hypothetical protein